MAITLLPDDLMHPKGKLQRSMFPDGDIIDNLVTWLEEVSDNTTIDAMADDDSNEAARHYVYYRAYETAAHRIALQPSSEQRTDVSRSWGQSRVDFFERKAAEHEAAYDGLIAKASGGTMAGALFTVAKARRGAVYCG